MFQYGVVIPFLIRILIRMRRTRTTLIEMSGISGIRIQIRIGKRYSDITMVEVERS